MKKRSNSVVYHQTIFYRNIFMYRCQKLLKCKLQYKYVRQILYFYIYIKNMNATANVSGSMVELMIRLCMFE